MFSKYRDANNLEISYMNTLFQADEKSRNKIAQALTAGGVPAGFYWLDKNNAKVAMSYTEFQGLSSAILDRNQVNFDKLQNLKIQINNATDKSTLATIIW